MPICESSRIKSVWWINIRLKVMNIFFRLSLETNWKKKRYIYTRIYKVGAIETFSHVNNTLSTISNYCNASSSSTRLIWFIIAAVINEGRQPHCADHAPHAFVELLIAPRGRARQVIHARHARWQRLVYRVCRESRAHFLPIRANIVDRKFISTR